MKTNIIYNEDCIGKKGMCILPDKSIDMILCDMPYGTTACKWDVIIPLKPLWKEYKRIIKDNGAMVLTARQPFTSMLVMNNLKMFSHQWVWKKNRNGNSLLVNIAPLKNFEDILVFIKNYENEYNDNPRREVLRKISQKYGKRFIIDLFSKEGRYTSNLSARVHASYKFGFSGGKRFDLMDKKLFDYLRQYIEFGFDYGFFNRTENRMNASQKRTYNPQGVVEINKEKIVGKKPQHIGARLKQEGIVYIQKYKNYPSAIIEFNIESKPVHPTQKPVTLFEYLIKTYTNEGDIILDNCMGSGTTAVACVHLKRRYIGFDTNKKYCKVAETRLEAEKTLWD